MNTKQLIARAKYVSLVQRYIESVAFEIHEKELNDKIDALARKNSQLLGIYDESFMYKNKIYTSHRYQRIPNTNKYIHPEIMDEVVEVLDSPDFDAAVERNRVSNYIGNALTVAQHRDDLFLLFPSRLHKALRDVDHNSFTIGNPMNEEEAKAFKTIYHNDYVAFGRLFLERLLLT